MDAGLINGVLFLDIKKAFDTVDHKILLAKLYSYDIRGTSHEWFGSYLQNRKQICSINGRASIAREVGVVFRKGLILGPSCFFCI